MNPLVLILSFHTAVATGRSPCSLDMHKSAEGKLEERTFVTLLLAVTLLSVRPIAAAECSASSVAELQSKFEKAFRSKNPNEFLSLFTWVGVDSESERLFKDDLSSMLKKHLIRSEVRDAKFAIEKAL